jgi:hypothetical protein
LGRRRKEEAWKLGWGGFIDVAVLGAWRYVTVELLAQGFVAVGKRQ